MAQAVDRERQSTSERLLTQWGLADTIEFWRLEGEIAFFPPETWMVTGTLKPGITFSEVCHRVHPRQGLKVREEPNFFSCMQGDWGIMISRHGDEVTVNLTEPPG